MWGREVYRIGYKDFLLIGSVKYVPLITDFIVFIICFFAFPGSREAWLFIEILVPFGSIWIGTFHLTETTRKHSLYELIFSCNRRLPVILTVRYITLSFLSSIVGVFVSVFICIPVDMRAAGYYSVLIFFEVAAFTGIAFLLATILKSPGWTITIVMSIIISDYGTQGKIFGALHFSLYWYEELSVELILPRIITASYIAVASYVVGYTVLKKFASSREGPHNHSCRG